MEVVIGMVSSETSVMVVVLDVGNVDETSDSDAVELHAARDTQAAKVTSNFFFIDTSCTKRELLDCDRSLCTVVSTQVIGDSSKSRRT